MPGSNISTQASYAKLPFGAELPTSLNLLARKLMLRAAFCYYYLPTNA